VLEARAFLRVLLRLRACAQSSGYQMARLLAVVPASHALHVVYSSLSRLLSVVRETLRRHRWLATSRALRPKSARSLDSCVDRPTPTLDCKRQQARVRKLASAHPPTRPRAPTCTSTHARLRPLSGGARSHSAVAICAPCMNAHLFVPEQQNSNHDKNTQRAQTHTHTQTRTRTHTHTPGSMMVRRRWPATQPQRRRARPASTGSATTFLRT
jgi:hypothetical protein